MQIRIFGNLIYGTGYGEMAREFARAISLSGADVCLKNMAFNHPTIRFNEQMAEFINTHQVEREPHISIYCTIPMHVSQFFELDPTAERRILFTMIEGKGKIAPSYVAGCNAVDEVWLPTQANLDTFAGSWVETPMEIVPLGIDTETWKPDFSRQTLKGNEYVFFTNFSWATRYRKGFNVLCHSYLSEFTSKDKVRLYVKTSGDSKDPDRIAREVRAYCNIMAASLDIDDPPTVEVLARFTAGRELLQLYHDVDCFVLPTRGEGWCLPALEAMACGVPVIITGEGSQTAFCNNDNSLLIKNKGYNNAPRHAPEAELIYSGLKWAEPDARHLSRLMRWCYKNRGQAKNIGMKGLKTAQGFTWKQSAEIALSKINQKEGIQSWRQKSILHV